MKPPAENNTIDELVLLFEANCLQQDKALLEEDISRFNKLFDGMVAINDELKRRGTHARLNLKRLFDHENMQVRLQAARLTLGVAPAEARQVIEAISRSAWMPQAGDAGMCLWALDEGISKPT